MKTQKKRPYALVNPLAKYKRLERRQPSKPVIFDLSRKQDFTRFQKFLKGGQVQKVRDGYRAQLRELFAIKNPPLVFSGTFEREFAKHHKQLVSEVPEWQQGRWVYFPWISLLVHILQDDDFQRVRTARNRELISEEEQQKFYSSSVGIGGLSIGNAVALTLTLVGGPHHIRLADFDTLDLSNLNRIRAGVDELGAAKLELTARQIYLLNPYAKVELFSRGLGRENIEAFADGLSLIVDELDDLAVKLLVREEARRKRIPVIMAADCADNAVIDVERYDLNSSIEPFHGRLGMISYDELRNLSKKETGRLIAKLVGLENHTQAMLESLSGLGKTLASWPQLGSTAQLNGAALAYCARRILTGRPLVTNRSVVSFDALLNPENNDPAWQKQHSEALAEFARVFGI